MKIAIFSDCYLDLTGGIVTAIDAEKTELERRGHTVYIFSSAYPRTKKEKEALARKNIFSVPSCKVFGRGLTPIARRPKIIERWLVCEHPEILDFDIYYIHYEAGASIAGMRLAKAYGIPCVQVMHGREDVGEANLIPFGLRTFVATMLNWFHSWYLPHPIKVPRDKFLARTRAKAKMWSLMVNHANCADLVITPSRHFGSLLKHYGVSRTIIALHHGVPDALAEAPASRRELNPGEPLKMIWHSRVSGEKRIMPFLEALKLLGGERYSLEVYGDGPELPQARAYAKLNRLNVKFYGNQPYKKITGGLKRADLDVLVSYDYDTFGMILIEAEAAGVPVFIADPALKEIVPAGGYILAEGPEPEKMAAALSKLLEEPEKLAKMSEKMVINRDKIKISATITKLLEIFTKLGEENVENSEKAKKLMKKT